MSIVTDSHDALHNVTIILDKTLHFSAPDGSAVEVGPGSHRVDLGADGHLQLASLEAPHHPGQPLRTFNVWHRLALDAPLSVIVIGEGHAHHIVLLLPGGAALQSTGSPHRQAEHHTQSPKFVTTADLAQAILDWTPSPSLPVLRFTFPFTRPSVLKVGVVSQPWGTIEPDSKATPFLPGSVPPTWISATVAVCKASPGASCAPPGTPQSRTIGTQLFSLTSVTVKSMLTWAGKTVDLVATTQVTNPGGCCSRYMTVTDVYRMVPGANGPITFQNVIAATALPEDDRPIYKGKTRGEEAAYDLTGYPGYPPPGGRGAPTLFELHVNGITQAYKDCEYFGNFPFGAPEPAGPPFLFCR
jgi:hypothetical protein